MSTGGGQIDIHRQGYECVDCELQSMCHLPFWLLPVKVAQLYVQIMCIAPSSQYSGGPPKLIRLQEQDGSLVDAEASSAP